MSFYNLEVAYFFGPPCIAYFTVWLSVQNVATVHLLSLDIAKFRQTRAEVARLLIDFLQESPEMMSDMKHDRHNCQAFCGLLIHCTSYTSNERFYSLYVFS